MSKILAIFLALALSACGYRGPLELLPGPAPEPLLGNPKPAKPVPVSKIDPDLSTDKKALSQ